MGKKNNNCTASYKLKVISFAEQFGNRKAEREFGIMESSVLYWRKQNEALRNTKSDSRAFRGPKAGKYPALEDDYFEELRNDGIAVTHDMLQLRARELAKSHSISDYEFKVSRGWLRRFMKRKGLSLRRRTCDNDVNNNPSNVNFLFLIGVVQLAPQREVASRTHRSTIN